jgi:hypothetical protein
MRLRELICGRLVESDVSMIKKFSQPSRRTSAISPHQPKTVQILFVTPPRVTALARLNYGLCAFPQPTHPVALNISLQRANTCLLYHHINRCSMQLSPTTANSKHVGVSRLAPQLLADGLRLILRFSRRRTVSYSKRILVTTIKSWSL